MFDSGARATPAAIAALREWLIGAEPPRPSEAGEVRELVEAATRQGLAGLLSEALRSAEGPELGERLAALRRAQLFRGVQQLETLAWAADTLSRAGLRSLPLKGAALAELLYASVADRPMSDVDLLALDDFEASLDVLQGQGLRIVDEDDHAVALSTDGGIVVELHQGITSCPALFALDAEALWRRSSAGDAQVRRRPSEADLLVELALHASFQHGLVLSLVQWVDFRRLLERPLDAAHVLDIAAAAGASAALAVALEAAAILVAAPVPDALSAGLRAALPESDRRWLRTWLSEPSRCIAESVAPLARLRWMVTPGRRRAMVQATLRRRRGQSRSVPGRLLTLVSRWAGPTLRQLALRPRASEPLTPMSEIVPRRPSFAEQALRDCLLRFRRIQFRVTGRCMEPDLMPGQVVTVSTRPPRLGDIVLVSQADGLRLHRLVFGPPLASPGAAWRTKGDRSSCMDPPLFEAAILGTVVEPGRRRLGLAFRACLRALWARLRHGRRPSA